MNLKNEFSVKVKENCCNQKHIHTYGFQLFYPRLLPPSCPLPSHWNLSSQHNHPRFPRLMCVCVTHWGLLQLPVQTWVVSWRIGTYEWPHLWRKWLPLLRQSLTATVPQEEWDCVSAFPFYDEMLTCPICTGLMPITNSAPIPYSWCFSYVSLHWLLSEMIRDFSDEDWQQYWSVGINTSI